MTRFVVMEPAAGVRDKDVVFVRDRFRWLGLLFPLLWLLWHRLWLAALLWCVAVAAIGAAMRFYGNPSLAWLTFTVLALLVALEGPNWRIRKLQRLGYVDTHALNAESLGDAERLYAETILPERQNHPAHAAALGQTGAVRPARNLLLGHAGD